MAKFANGGWLDVGYSEDGLPVSYEKKYHTGGLVWGKSRYQIKEVQYSHHALEDKTEFIISYFDAKTGHGMGVVVHVNNSLIYKASSEYIMMMVADMAAQHVKDIEFYNALVKYFKESGVYKDDYKNYYQNKNHYDHIHVPALPPVDQEASKALFEGSLSKPASVGPNMQDVNDLPGVMEEVKHPVNGELHRIKDIIINLNDQHMWTREQIADWLETLDVDLRFKDPEVRLRDKQRKTLEAKLSLATAALEQHQKSVKEQRKIINKLKKELEALNEQD